MRRIQQIVTPDPLQELVQTHEGLAPASRSPLYDLIENRLELLDKTPAAQQGASQELQIDNHQAYIGKYCLMAQEYLTEEDLQDLFQVTCLTPAQRKEFVIYYR